MDFETIQLSTDLLIVGGGMASCGAAFEASYWAKKNNLKVLMVDKAAMDRSGAVAMGLSAINTYIGLDIKENTPEDFVKYVRNDQMGTIREDLVYDIGRHVDSSVHLFEKWGLPIWKDEKGNYQRAGRWQIMINGESYKVIVAEAAKNALGMENIIERLFIVKLLLDAKEPNRIAGAVGFSVRENKVYFIKAKAIMLGCGGAVHIFRPRSVGEGLGRTWYPPWNAGSNYAMMLQVGAELAQMESRFIPTRFKDGYGPVGAWFLFFKSRATNAFGEDYLATRADSVKPWAPYATAKPLPTPLRNHQMMLECMEGKGPVYMRTEEAIANLAAKYKDDPKAYKKKMKELESEAWEDFLDMTISQALLWAAQNLKPEEKHSEIAACEPYFIGSHSGASGAWVSGPEDLPTPYKWGYANMTTAEALFAVGDGSGASSHKFSSGSHAEGRIAGKSAIKYIVEKGKEPKVDMAEVEKLKAKILLPLDLWDKHSKEATDVEVNTNYLLPRQFLH